MSDFRKLFDNAENSENKLINKDSLKVITLKQIEECWAFWINDTRSQIEDGVKGVDDKDEYRLR